LLQQQGSQEAWAFARVSLQRQPSLLGLDRALTAEVHHLGDNRAAEIASSDEGLSPSLLRKQLSRSAQRLDRFGCRVCGFQAKQFYWQCPGCHGWETYRPRRLEELQ
jgi:lipopolysaccharide assembly protein B